MIILMVFMCPSFSTTVLVDLPDPTFGTTGQLEQYWIVTFSVLGVLAFILIVLLIVAGVYFSGKDDAA